MLRKVPLLGIFLSTLSLRRATFSLLCRILFRRYFYPRSPCGERHVDVDIVITSCHNFYPRSPCGERPADKAKTSNAVTFLSTLSLRRATEDMIFDEQTEQISIHALLAESDSTTSIVLSMPPIFLSTLSLRRATVKFILSLLTYHLFLSTLSLRRATLLFHATL